MDANAFAAWFGQQLAALPAVAAVALGGSRAAGTATDSSDWDFALYYRGAFDPDDLRALGFDGEVFDVGAWGGGVMNGGAWLSVEGRRVDVMYRDLDDVEHWWQEAEAGRYEKQLLPFHLAGIPTYTVVGELAVGTVLTGELPRPPYPDALAVSAGSRWRIDATLSAGYARKALELRGDAIVAVANGSRALLELAHSRAALGRRWVLNEKGLVRASGLGDLGDALAFAAEADSLASALLAIEHETASD